MVDIKLYAAPMEGLTTYIWRRAQREVFGGVDKYFTPFLSPNGNLAFQQKELDEVTQGETDTVPQLLTNRGDYFVWAARELYAMGVREVNFNLGCPSGTVTAKRKGAGLLAYPEELDRCLEEVFAALPDMRVSIKTRIGKNDPAEWERLLAIYGNTPCRSSSSTRGCRRSSTAGRCTVTPSSWHWRGGGSRRCITATCSPWRRWRTSAANTPRCGR